TVLLRVPSFVTTLGTLFLVNGLTLTISSGTPVSPPEAPAFAAVMGNWGYSEICWSVLIVLVMHVVLRHTRWGLHTIAAGANPIGINAFTFNIILGAAILGPMLFNIHMTRISRNGRSE